MPRCWHGGPTTRKPTRPFAARPQPRIRAIQADVDLYPEDGALACAASTLLVNDTSKPIDEILVAVRRDASSTSVTIPSARKRHDARFNQHVFTLGAAVGAGRADNRAVRRHLRRTAASKAKSGPIR